jgi:hypothetical protein
MTVAITNRGFWPRTTKGGPGGQEETDVLHGILIAFDVIARGQEFREIHQRGYVAGFTGSYERATFRGREPKRALASFIMHTEEVVDLQHGANGTALGAGAASLGAID